MHKSCTIWPDTTAGLTLQKDVANEQYRARVSFQGPYLCSDPWWWPLNKWKEHRDSLSSYMHLLATCLKADHFFSSEVCGSKLLMFTAFITFCCFTCFILLLYPKLKPPNYTLYVSANLIKVHSRITCITCSSADSLLLTYIFNTRLNYVLHMQTG